MSYSFYGSKVVDFNISGGMGSDIALDLNLVECDQFNPSFSPPALGTPVQFIVDTFSFYGVLDTVKANDNNMYSAQINNGLHIIGGVELILNDYYGSVSSVPNLLNIFGYTENTYGFGGSGVNNAGVSWAVIASNVAALVNNISGNSYGGPINYKGFKYKIDLSSLPNIPSYYRINSDNINLVDFIGEVCSAGGHDYFITLEAPTLLEQGDGWSGTFKVNTISRINEPTAGKVAQFIEEFGCVTGKNYGAETRKDVHSKFVVGANLERIYFNYPQDGGDNSFDGGFIDSNEYMNDTVLPFFGVNEYNNIITGFTPSGEPNEYYFYADVSDIKGIESFESFAPSGSSPGKYLTSLSELRAARKGRESWENFLCSRDCNKYIIDPSSPVFYKFRYKIFEDKEMPAFLVDPDDSDYHNIPKFGYVFLKKIGRNDLITTFYPNESTVTNSKKLHYPSDGTKLNYYFQRASELKIANGRRIGFARMFEADLYTKSLSNDVLLKAYEQFKAELGVFDVETKRLSSENTYKSSRFKDLDESFNDNIVDQIYRKLKGYADTYYNRKFMVSIPFVLGAIEPESTTIRLSQEPINEGYIDEAAWDTAYSAGLIPDISGINTLISPENKFYAFVKYENCVITDPSGNVFDSLYDFSEISVNDKIFSTPVAYTGVEVPIVSGVSVAGYNVYDCWIKCSVDEKTYFHDSETLFGPRAIIEIPGSVKRNVGQDAATYAKAMMDLYDMSKQAGGAFADDPAVTQTFLRKQFDKIGADDVANHDGEPIQYANLYAIPLRSKLLCYGPWYSIGAAGKVAYERNTDLNPWNYGGFAAMNQAGLSRVEDGVTNQTFSEVGSVTVQGLPTKAFGDPLIAAGPYITSMSCSIGGGGKQTTYSFQSWSSHRTLSKLTGYSVERNKNLNRTVRDIKSNFREGIKTGKFKGVGDFYNKVSNRFIDLNDYTRRDRPSTSSKMISAEMNGPTATVAIQPNYNAAAQAYSNYEDKAFVSLDGIFRPYSTVPKSGWPSFQVPDDTGSFDINSITLNPTQKGHDFTALSVGTGYQDGGLLPEDYMDVEESGGFIPARSVALRMPLVGVGWGFDTNGNPVPAGTGENGFAPDYLYNSSGWKAGPIHLPWDESKKMWIGGGGQTEIYLSKVTNTYNPNSFSYEVERSNSRDQFTRSAPSIKRNFSSSGDIYDPEYLAYTANTSNIGTYEQLDYAGLEFPHYEAYIIRSTTDNVGNPYYNIWNEDCQDCGHISNPCGSGYGMHGASSTRKKILIENPLRQSLDTGDLAFTVKTGRSKNVNTGQYIGGSGIGASGNVVTDASGFAVFEITAPGSGYEYGAFGLMSSGICASLTLVCESGYLLSGSISPSGGFEHSKIYPAIIYPVNATVETESLDIHWILQAEFKYTQVNTYVGCDGGLLQTCSVKIQTQGQKSCEWCGEDTALVNSF